LVLELEGAAHPRATTVDPIAFAVPDITEDDIAAVTGVLRSGWITTGTECQALESELATYLDVRHVVTMSSGTAALETALAFLDLPAGSRVGVPTWTFVSTALAAVHRGLQPVLLDVEEDSLNLDPRSLEAALGLGLDAVVGVHFAGVALSLDVHELCGEAGVPLIEDGAHALGATDHRGMVAGQGTGGACFSFYATKNLTAGEGGALATDNDDLARFALSFRLHGLSHDAWARYNPGSSAGYDLLGPGIKGNLSDVAAGLARSQLRRFPQMQQARRALGRHYRDQLAGSGVRFVPDKLDEDSADHLLVVVLPESAVRADVMDRMTRADVATSVHFQPLHTFAWFAHHATVGPTGTIHADAVAAQALSLPMHTRMSVGDVDRVCDALRDAVR
jgi:dTDP-4-amino-4,6-dideoxygalactose transaminase